MSKTPKAIQNLLDELEASRQSRKRAWEILQEIRWVLKDTAGIEAQQPARKTIDLEAIREYRKLAAGYEQRRRGGGYADHQRDWGLRHA
jgi:hypothetical protein